MNMVMRVVMIGQGTNDPQITPITRIIKNVLYSTDLSPQITPVRSSGPTGQAQITRITYESFMFQ